MCIIAPMSAHEVVVAGGGPTGMMVAAELALAGVDVAMVERRPDHALAGSRAGGFHARTLEVLDQRGIADRFLAAGQTAQVMSFGATTLDLSDFPTRHPHSLGIWQNEIERILSEWVAELPVHVLRGREVAGFAQDEDGVEVRLGDGGSLGARYLVGCDGGRSRIRRQAGIAFPGWEATRSTLIAEVELSEEPPPGLRHDDAGVHALSRLDGSSERFRVVTAERQVRSGAEPSLGELREALVTVFGRDFGAHSPTWISRFTDATRHAEAYRERRVLLAGDAAHVHYPAGGQGVGLGLQDAVNLGWKLARVVKGTSPAALLDSYGAERHPATARVLRFTMALTALQRRDERMQALVDEVSVLAAMDEPRRRLAGIASGLDVHYDVGEGHPLLGRRMPDLDLTVAEGPRRVFELLHAARPLLLDLDRSGPLDLAAWADQVQHVRATCADAWELPVIGAVSAPSAVLVRPDGHVAWVGEGDDAGLRDALGTWFGPSA